jgi:hypothetical protein
MSKIRPTVQALARLSKFKFRIQGCWKRVNVSKSQDWCFRDHITISCCLCEKVRNRGLYMTVNVCYLCVYVTSSSHHSKKVNLSLWQAVDAHRVVRRRGSHILKTIGTQMAVRLSALRAGHSFPPGRILVLISLRGWVEPRAIVRLEGLGQLKNSITLLGVTPATFRLLA